ncbi:MAG: hypothetical protein CMO35_05080 [Verrucomicrobiaceae bacterium]|nr:hypothetical protein [Verrucomicrobiaceae bacterium]
MKNLVLLLVAFALIGCREKKEARNEGPDAGKADTEAINSKPDLSASNGGAPVKKHPEYDYDKLEGIDVNDLVFGEEDSDVETALGPISLVYVRGSDAPYTGQAHELYREGKKEWEGPMKNGAKEGWWLNWDFEGRKVRGLTFKGGIPDGPMVAWHANGQIMSEGRYKNGEPLEGSIRFWNSKGEEVDSEDEAMDGLPR